MGGTRTMTRVSLAVLAPVSILALSTTATVVDAAPAAGPSHQQSTSMRDGRQPGWGHRWQQPGGDGRNHRDGGGQNHHGWGHGGGGGITIPVPLPPVRVPPPVKVPPVTTTLSGVVSTATGALRQVSGTVHRTVHEVETVTSAGITSSGEPVRSGVKAATALATPGGAAGGALAAHAGTNSGLGPSVVLPPLPEIIPTVLPVTASDEDVMQHLPLGWFGALAAVDLMFAVLLLRRRHRLPERVSRD
jgi:hypothetical protein